MADNSVFPASTRARRYLASGYALLIVYASLSPFTGWRDQGIAFSDVLAAPLWLTYNAMDALINVLAYIPLGALLVLIFLGRFARLRSVLLSVIAGLSLSAAMEYAQMYLPVRTSSNLDMLTNTAGTLAGAVAAIPIASSAWFVALTQSRRSLVRQGRGVDFGLALAALWMFAQVNPSLPMLGNIFISETERAPFQPAPAESFAWLASAATALNLLMLGCLYMTLLQRRRHALVAVALTMSLVAVCKFLAAAILFKSWALLLWLTSESMLGIVAGLALLAFASRMPNRVLSACAALAAIAYLALGEGVLDGRVPPGLAHLYYWPEGHFLTYNGLSHFILLMFPPLLLGYLWRARNW
jgi:VanZ family protein